jgi:hypothetical protein
MDIPSGIKSLTGFPALAGRASGALFSHSRGKSEPVNKVNLKNYMTEGLLLTAQSPKTIIYDYLMLFILYCITKGLSVREY